MLFTGSIEENIRFGKSDATDDEVQAAAKMANAHEFIMALPEVSRDGALATNATGCLSRTTRHRRATSSAADRSNEVGVGEEGRSWCDCADVAVAIARALISNPRILLLDEATSALGKFTVMCVCA